MLKSYALKNKMKVLLASSHKAPVVAVQVWVKTGSADEKKGQEGISHFIEHLVFKGTDKYGVGEIARTVEGSGGELNAYTTFDYTVFHVTISSDQVDVGLDTISQMMGFPKFDPKEIDNERGVVIEEIKRSSDSPGRVASQQIFSTVFRKHPYGIPIIGYDKIIEKVSPKTLVGYYRSRYVPSNMTLVVVGDLQKDIKPKIEKYFGGFSDYKLKKVSRAKEPSQSQRRVQFQATEFKEAQMNLAFVAPPLKHKDVPAIDLLGMILGQGDSSRLMKTLRLEKALVTSVSAGAYNPLDQGMFIVGCSFQPKNFFEIGEVITQQFVQLLSQPVSLEELNRARTKIESEEIFSLETVDGVARKVGMFQTLLGDPDYINWYLKEIHRLTPVDLVKVARKYFVPNKFSVSALVHQEDQKIVSRKVLEKWAKDFSKAIAVKGAVKGSSAKTKAKPAKMKISLAHESSGHLEKITLKSGAHVILKPNKGIPSFSLKVGFRGGSRAEDDRLLGLTTALSNSWTTGTHSRTEAQIAEEIEDLGGQLSAFGGRNSLGLSLEGLKVYEDRTLRLFGDVLTDPVFKADYVERELEVQRENIKSRADYPSSLAIQLFGEMVFEGHPYARDPLGTLETIDQIKQHDIVQYFRKYATGPNAVISLAGDFDRKKVLEFLEETTSRLSRHENTFSKQSPNKRAEEKFRYQSINKNQSHIIFGYNGLTLDDPDRPTLQVIQALLSGQGGRLFIELRDKASLAYSVAPIELEGTDAGYFGTYIGCSPEKGEKAVRMMREELDKLVKITCSEEEVERAKRYLIGRNSIDLQRNGSQATAILFDELYGMDSHKVFRYAEMIKPVGPKDVQRVAKRIFRDQSPGVGVAVGPINPFKEV